MSLPDVAQLLAKGVPRVMILILFLLAYTDGLEFWMNIILIVAMCMCQCAM